MRRTLVFVSLLALGLYGCDSGPQDSATEASTDEAANPEQIGDPSAPTTDDARPQIPVLYCDEIPDLSDSLDFAGAQYNEFSNGYLTGSALAYALQFPYYVAVWPRTHHESWLIVGVTGGMAELQADLDLQFPGARVLAMNITWDPFTLDQDRNVVAAALSDVAPNAFVDWSVSTGQITVEVPAGDLTPDLIDGLDRFEGTNVCVDLLA